jgi:hypothetical protein
MTGRWKGGCGEPQVAGEPNDLALALIVRVWERLPKANRTGIPAMVNAARS